MRFALPLLVAFLFFLSPPLSAGTAPDPETVAFQYWQACTRVDLDGIKKVIRKVDLKNPYLADATEVRGKFSLGGAIIFDDKVAKVPTTLREENDLSTSFHTVLVKEDGQWRVNLRETMLSYAEAQIDAIADSVPARPRGASSPYTHVIPQATSYYLNGPQQAMPPQGSFRPGTKVIILQDMGSYVRVKSEDGIEAAVSSGSLQKIK